MKIKQRPIAKSSFHRAAFDAAAAALLAVDESPNKPSSKRWYTITNVGGSRSAARAGSVAARRASPHQSTYRMSKRPRSASKEVVSFSNSSSSSSSSSSSVLTGVASSISATAAAISAAPFSGAAVYGAPPPPSAKRTTTMKTVSSAFLNDYGPGKSSTSSNSSSSSSVVAESSAASSLIQFVAMSSEGSPVGPVLEIPGDATPVQLELLLNQLLEPPAGSPPQPYSFYINDVEVVGAVSRTLEEQGLSSEDVHSIRYQPLAVFRVLPVTRCSDTIPASGEAILHVSFSPDGRLLASGGGDAVVRIFDARSSLPKLTLEGHKHHVLCVAWSPDGSRLASADRSGVVRVWDAKTGKEACKALQGHASWVTSLAWEPLHRCGKNPGCRPEFLASSSKDKTVRVWNTRTGTLLTTIGGHSDGVEVVRWGGEGLLYTASRDKTILIWAFDDVARDRFKLIRTLSGHGHRINSIALNTDVLTRSGPFDHKGIVPATSEEGKRRILGAGGRAVHGEGWGRPFDLMRSACVCIAISVRVHCDLRACALRGCMGMRHVISSHSLSLVSFLLTTIISTPTLSLCSFL